MPELAFYLNEDDFFRIGKFVLAAGAWLVPDLYYESASYMEIRDLETLETIRTDRNEALFFILSQDYYECPLEMRSVEKEGKEVFYISQKNGGPAIDFFCLKAYEKDGVLFIPAGSLGYYPSYWNAKTGRMERPPDRLKSFYKEISKEIKKDSETVRYENGKFRKRFIVGKSANADLSGGVRLAGFSAD